MNIVKTNTWLREDQPVYKVVNHGAAHVSTCELLAIIIGKDSMYNNALDMAKDLMMRAENDIIKLCRMTITEICQTKGITELIATRIITAFELGRRRQATIPRTYINVRNSESIAAFLKPLIQDMHIEVFGVIMLNRANRVIKWEIISRGGITGTVADTRVIFKHAVEAGAVAIVLFHNHPSGNLEPSTADKELTQKHKEAGKIMDIPLLDHIIIGDTGYFSFADDGIL